MGIAVTGLMALALALTSMLPAAAGDVVISFDAPTPLPGAILQGPQTVKVTARAGLLGLRSFSVQILSEDPSIPAPARKEQRAYETLDVKGEDTIVMSWDTAAARGYNGRYRIVVRAASLLDGNDAGTSKEITGLKVSNPPRAPAGVAAAQEGEVVALHWTANSEPDTLGYRIERSLGGGAFALLGSAEGRTSTSFKDAGAPKGVELAYRVVAIRKSPTESGLIESSASSPTKGLTVPPPPPPPGQAQAPPDPLALPTIQPPALVQVEAKKVTLPRRDTFFAPELPFSEPLPEPGPRQVLEKVGEETVPQAPNRTVSGAQPGQKWRFGAASLLLTILSLHIRRTARRLFKSSAYAGPAPA
ncbi:MAG: hypothetical protein ACRDIF_06720 [Actinomycetota bacterium]